MPKVLLRKIESAFQKDKKISILDSSGSKEVQESGRVALKSSFTFTADRETVIE